MKTLRPNLILVFLALSVSVPILDGGSKEEDFSETLLSKDNAYNPIPSPDSKYIAYVRTGWGRPGGSGGFGRSNLVSEVIVIDQKSMPTTAKPLEDMFLEGWTRDSSQLVCFRDRNYAIVSTDGKHVEEGRIPYDADKHPHQKGWLICHRSRKLFGADPPPTLMK